MKTNFVCFKLSKTVVILLVIILLQLVFIAIGIKDVRETKSFEQIKNEHVGDKKTTDKNNINDNQNSIENDIVVDKRLYSNSNDIKNNTIESNKMVDIEEYKYMPREKKGYKVIGKIEIPKLKLNSYILSETNKKSLKVSVTKLYGPDINKVGNFCIAGHNYRNNKMFGGIKKLENKDKIILTDTYGRSVTYEVYQNYQIDPKDVSPLNQDTGGEREVTLITCTLGAIKRVIVKAVEVYD